MARAAAVLSEARRRWYASSAVEARPAEDVAPPLLLRADHPFVFLIHHLCTNHILFLGRLADPSGEAGPAMKAREP